MSVKPQGIYLNWEIIVSERNVFLVEKSKELFLIPFVYTQLT